jgi:hypothetical protein
LQSFFLPFHNFTVVPKKSFQHKATAGGFGIMTVEAIDKGNTRTLFIGLHQSFQKKLQGVTTDKCALE